MNVLYEFFKRNPNKKFTFTELCKQSGITKGHISILLKKLIAKNKVVKINNYLGKLKWGGNYNNKPKRDKRTKFFYKLNKQ